MEEIVLLYTTWPDAETAQAAARAAVEARLAACANIVPAMQSIYRWEGQIQQTVESAMLLKTKGSCSPALRELIASLHPYATPCIIELSVQATGSNTEFLRWIEEQTAAAT